MCVCNLSIYALSEIFRILIVEMPKNNDIFHLSLDIISLMFEYPAQYVLRKDEYFLETHTRTASFNITKFLCLLLSCDVTTMCSSKTNKFNFYELEAEGQKIDSCSNSDF